MIWKHSIYFFLKFQSRQFNILLHILLPTLVLVVKLTFKDLEEVLDCKNKYNLKNQDNLEKGDFLKHKDDINNEDNLRYWEVFYHIFHNVFFIYMFSCDYCEYQIASSEILNIHNRTLHGKEEKYNCDIICGCQLSNQISLATRKKIEHKIPLKKRDLL